MMNEGLATREVPGHSATVSTVISTLESLVQDWDIEDTISPATKVVADLGFESVDLIQMVGALEQAFRPRKLSLVDMLVADGRYVDDLTVGEIAEHVSRRLQANEVK